MPPHHDVRDDHRRQFAQARLAREPNKLWRSGDSKRDALEDAKRTPPCSRSSGGKTAASTSSPIASSRGSIPFMISLNGRTASFGAPQAVARSASCWQKTRPGVGPRRPEASCRLSKRREARLAGKLYRIRNTHPFTMRGTARLASSPWGCRTIGRAVDLSSCRMYARGPADQVCRCTAAFSCYSVKMNGPADQREP